MKSLTAWTIVAMFLLGVALSGITLGQGPLDSSPAERSRYVAMNEATAMVSSDLGESGKSASNVNSIVPPSGSDNITLTAGFNYTSENGREVRPCAGGYVQLWRVNTFDSYVERSGTTDENGTIQFIDLLPGRFNLEISTWDERYVEVKQATVMPMASYQWSTGDFFANSTSAINHLIKDSDRGAWSAFEAVREGALWLKDRTGYEMGEVAINWPSGTWPSSSGSTIEIPASDVDGNYIWQRGTLLHEYAHCVHFAVRGGSFPYSEGLEPHYIDSVSNGPFALTEGWAEFFERAVIGDPIRTDKSSLESTIYADGPFFNGDYGDWDGNTVEGAVANVLWDILDGVSATDNPSWDPQGTGDQVDNQFEVFWNIFSQELPRSMYDVYQAWPNMNDSLRTIFYHARFQINTGHPLNPTYYESDRKIMVESDDSTVDVSWGGAIDFTGGIGGYSIVWDGEPNTMPDEIIDTYETTAVSPPLSEGLWYLHIRAISADGDAANGSYNIGPFVIAANATDQSSGTGDISFEGWEVVYLGIMAAVIIVVIMFVWKQIKRPEEDQLPPAELQSGMTWGSSYDPYNAGYPPPPPSPPIVPLDPPPNPDGTRFCRNCGRNDVGGAFCPFCGYRLR